MSDPHPNQLVLAGLLALTACKDAGSGDTHGEEDPSEHACESIADAGTAVTAAADLASAPEIEASESPYTITLADNGDGTYGGFVGIHVHEDGDNLLFAGTADVVTGLYEDGAASTLAEGGPNSFCEADIPEHWDLELTAGDWQLELGPSATDTVWIMLLAEGHDHEHEER